MIQDQPDSLLRIDVNAWRRRYLVEVLNYKDHGTLGCQELPLSKGRQPISIIKLTPKLTGCFLEANDLYSK